MRFIKLKSLSLEADDAGVAQICRAMFERFGYIDAQLFQYSSIPHSFCSSTISHHLVPPQYTYPIQPFVKYTRLVKTTLY